MKIRRNDGMDSLILVQGIKKSYQGRSILNGVSLEIKPKEVLAIIGPNGVGKTTTVEIILGMRNYDSGSIQYSEVDIKKDLGAQLQNTPTFYNLTVEENIRMFCSFYNVKEIKSVTNEIIEKFELEEVKKSNVLTLSGGQKKRLSIALATLHNPRVIFLDEPTADLDPRGRIKIRNIIKSLVDNEKSVVFTSHDMNEVIQIADRVILFDDGLVKEAGKPEEIISKYNARSLEEVYLLLTEKNDGGERKYA
jgi:ABC-2 type transport system ATP-binding protein